MAGSPGEALCTLRHRMKDGLRSHLNLTDEMQQLMTQLSRVPGTIAVKGGLSNGMAERFVNTMKEDDITFMPQPDVKTALHNPAVAFGHYNEWHPHSALGYISPEEYRHPMMFRQSIVAEGIPSIQ